MITMAWVSRKDERIFLTVKSIRLQKQTTIELSLINDPKTREIFVSWAEEVLEERLRNERTAGRI